jgi:L-amino acid N-acyltransferase YncA
MMPPSLASRPYRGQARAAIFGPGADDAGAGERETSAVEVRIRAAAPDDAGAIAAIYNQGIEGREATFETAARTGEDFAGPLADPASPPFIVAETAEGVAGFARLTPCSSRACYAGVGEASVYVAASYRGASVGRRLLDAVAAEAERRGYWKLVGLLFPENRRSVALCASAGFREVGVLRRHGRLERRWRDVLLVERLLEPQR